MIEIDKAELFRVLPGEQLHKLRTRIHPLSIERQQVLYFEGNPADRLWVVRTGQVRLYKSSPNGSLTTLDVLGPGEAFGAISALETEVYPASAEAVTDCSVWWLSRERFLRLLAEEPRIGGEILQILSRRLRDAHDRLRAFAHDPAPARLAAALLRAAADGEARVTRRALAEAAGTTVETAIRVLRRFQRDGLIEGHVGRIQIVDEPALRVVSKG
jgi:CRP/FNR family transcriptional regulator